MTTELKTLLAAARTKLTDAAELVAASLDKVSPYDPAKSYTPDEREPYDALCDRFVRGTEVAIKYFRTWERYEFAEQSETLRDLLNRTEKHGLITSVELWFRMRDLRNRIVHDYLPSQVKEMYDDLMTTLGPELIRTSAHIRH